MQKSQKPENVKTPKELEEKLGAERAKTERLELAKKFKYLSQENNPRILRKLPIDKVRYASFYAGHKKAVDKLHFILRKYSINEDDFLSYATSKYKVYTPELLLREAVFRDYAENKNIEHTYGKIFISYTKSVEFVAESCVRLGISPKRFILDEFASGRISSDFISGRISKYMIASIQNFKKLYDILDHLSKDELRIIYDAADELKVMVNEAVFKKTGRYPRPIRDSEDEVEKIKNKQTI